LSYRRFLEQSSNGLKLGLARKRSWPDMSCPECGFGFDPDNESQVVCPACGADPTAALRPDDDPTLAAAFEDGAAFAESPVDLADMLGENLPTEPEIDYVPDPDLDLAITDAEALREALTDGPILVAGNRLIN
jgi:rubredoxin